MTNFIQPDMTGVNELPRSKRNGERARRVIAANPGISDEALAVALFGYTNPTKNAADYMPVALAEVKILRTDGEI